LAICPVPPLKPHLKRYSNHRWESRNGSVVVGRRHMPQFCYGGILKVLVALAAGFPNPPDPGCLYRLGRAAGLNQSKKRAKCLVYFIFKNT
jgi:hypothetical protein